MATKTNKTTNDIKTERNLIEIIQDIDFRLTHLEDIEMDNRKFMAKLVKQGNTIVEFLKQFATKGSIISNQMDVPMIGQERESSTPSLHINAESEYFIQNSSIGDMSLEDLDREAIERTLKFFRNNRRATAKSLGMSERTLYRKIDQYGLERKIKV